MFVIVETGGKQYRVSQGNVIKVEKLNGENDDKVKLNRVLLLQKDDGSVFVGVPFLDNVEVDAVIKRTFKDDKVIDFHKSRRKNSRRKNGHRQSLTELKINDIIIK
ncbi:MAG: 50S ribosomal protein L21 [Rickettsiales bacterium]|jgi:large subunit ribosomal protein L21|nr:50S ribosomal protein L21 [Rickettsiales bacterium]